MKFKIVIGNSVDHFNIEVDTIQAQGYFPCSDHKLTFDQDGKMYISQQYMKREPQETRPSAFDHFKPSGN